MKGMTTKEIVSELNCLEVLEECEQSEHETASHLRCVRDVEEFDSIVWFRKEDVLTEFNRLFNEVKESDVNDRDKFLANHFHDVLNHVFNCDCDSPPGVSGSRVTPVLKKETGEVPNHSSGHKREGVNGEIPSIAPIEDTHICIDCMNERILLGGYNND